MRDEPKENDVDLSFTSRCSVVKTVVQALFFTLVNYERIWRFECVKEYIFWRAECMKWITFFSKLHGDYWASYFPLIIILGSQESLGRDDYFFWSKHFWITSLKDLFFLHRKLSYSDDFINMYNIHLWYIHHKYIYVCTSMMKV